ncbi:unnamed protein product [Blepharisma stoltei]|uniref:Uncharacterized protein n=1 Tax=Blepharisma stoltei TaxID=1481888 RepID=A0AAU9I8M9_9CILI|nr:unnamed protein product [Blepharisma stoltei]
MLDVGRNLLTLIANEKESAEQDNMRVYIGNIPDHFALSDPEDVNMIQPKFPPKVDIMSPIAGCLRNFGFPRSFAANCWI